MKILISNDDGINAPGLVALYQALAPLAEVKVVAPDVEQSGAASSLHISQPLYTQTLSSDFTAVTGSPADCVYLALHELYPDTEFDCVITGINAGENLGQNVLFSGTLGAAMTARLFGFPAIATSLVGQSVKGDAQDQVSHYQMAAKEIVKLITDTSIVNKIKSLPHHVLNINIPSVDRAEDIKGRKITRLGHSLLAKPVHHIVDPRGRSAYWIGLKKRQHPKTGEYIDADDVSWATLAKSEEASVSGTKQRLPADKLSSPIFFTDDQAVAAGYISLSPVLIPHAPKAALDEFSALIL